MESACRFNKSCIAFCARITRSCSHTGWTSPVSRCLSRQQLANITISSSRKALRIRIFVTCREWSEHGYEFVRTSAGCLSEGSWLLARLSVAGMLRRIFSRCICSVAGGRYKADPSLQSLRFDHVRDLGGRTQPRVTTSQSALGGHVSCMQLPKGFQVVYPFSQVSAVKSELSRYLRMWYIYIFMQSRKSVFHCRCCVQ